MNILKNVVNGMSSQFGREFGRAAANSVLKGSNNYTVTSDYSSRIKPSDSELVTTIKKAEKLKFITSDKGNVSSLIDLVNLCLPLMKFSHKSLDELRDLDKLNDIYTEKFEHGEALISDDYSGIINNFEYKT